MKIRIMPVKTRVLRILFAAAALLLFIVSFWFLNLDIGRFIARFSNASRILRLLLQVNPGIVISGFQQFFISFLMGVAGLILGGCLAFILAFLAADNIAPFKPLAILIKAYVSIVRAVPSLVIMLMIVAAIGLGYTTGVVGLTLSSMGYLTKAFIASIEEQDKGIIIAMRATGATWGQIVIHGLLPKVTTGFLAWIAIRLETSVAESITLGVVGAGGIGALLSRSIRQFDYPSITVLILIIFVCMFALELVSGNIRKRFC
ncbi:MAG: ABC transporter permease subunit [Firmicutes bacterium]|nr:ABC transporter permease subunit [Bacillota bacterium]